MCWMFGRFILFNNVEIRGRWRDNNTQRSFYPHEIHHLIGLFKKLNLSDACLRVLCSACRRVKGQERTNPAQGQILCLVAWTRWDGLDDQVLIPRVSLCYICVPPVLSSNPKSWWPACPRCRWSPLQREPSGSCPRRWHRPLSPAWWPSRVSSPCPLSRTSAAETPCRKRRDGRFMLWARAAVLFFFTSGEIKHGKGGRWKNTMTKKENKN